MGKGTANLKRQTSNVKHRMHRLHIVPEISEANGVYQVARMLAREDGGDVIDAKQFNVSGLKFDVGTIDEIWVHGMWLPRIWKTCQKVLELQTSNLKRQTSNLKLQTSNFKLQTSNFKRQTSNVKLQTSNFKRQTSNVKPSLVRMTHGSLSPIYLEKQGKWKKRFVAPIERWLFERTDRVVVTCEEEKKWCQKWGLKNEVEILDLKRFFKFQVSGFKSQVAGERALHVMYLGRRHPLKGVEFLERAVREIQMKVKGAIERSEIAEGLREQRRVELRIVSDHFGEELERDWEWCDVLCLPTLSENFGLVVAEALERGKRVITTDGAPVWEPPEAAEVKVRGEGEQWRERLVYLRGYRDGTDEERVELLKRALFRFVGISED